MDSLSDSKTGQVNYIRCKEVSARTLHTILVISHLQSRSACNQPTAGGHKCTTFPLVAYTVAGIKVCFCLLISLIFLLAMVEEMDLREQVGDCGWQSPWHPVPELTSSMTCPSQTNSAASWLPRQTETLRSSPLYHCLTSLNSKTS